MAQKKKSGNLAIVPLAKRALAVKRANFTNKALHEEIQRAVKGKPKSLERRMDSLSISPRKQEQILAKVTEVAEQLESREAVQTDLLLSMLKNGSLREKEFALRKIISPQFVKTDAENYQDEEPTLMFSLKLRLAAIPVLWTFSSYLLHSLLLGNFGTVGLVVSIAMPPLVLGWEAISAVKDRIKKLQKGVLEEGSSQILDSLTDPDMPELPEANADSVMDAEFEERDSTKKLNS